MFEQLFRKIAGNAGSIDTAGEFPAAAFEWMHAEGLMTIVLPGQALDFRADRFKELLFLLQDVGAANLSVGRIYEGHINALQLIHLYASPGQLEQWYEDVRKGKIFGVWNAEDQSGVTIEKQAESHYRLDGSKIFCSGGHWVQRPVVTGRLKSANINEGWQMCIIPLETTPAVIEDKSFWNPMGMQATASFRMNFPGITIGREDLLGPPDSYYREPYFNGGSIRFAAVQLGGARAIVEETHRFLKQLDRTGTDFQRARMAEMGMLLESGNNWLRTAADKMTGWSMQPASFPAYTNYSGMVRCAIEKICTGIMHLSEVSVGTRGLMKPDSLERIHRDLHFYLRQPAPDAVITGVGQYLFQQENFYDAWK